MVDTPTKAPISRMRFVPARVISQSRKPRTTGLDAISSIEWRVDGRMSKTSCGLAELQTRRMVSYSFSSTAPGPWNLSLLTAWMGRRSEERRVGKEWVRTSRSRVSPYHEKKKTVAILFSLVNVKYIYFH